ncbi:hypothetical protein Emag_003867 [Eimeria magna]
MALIGSCCGRAPAEAEKLPLRVPVEMAEDIQKNTRLSLKEIQGLYNSYTGTGECLDDYRYNFATRSESGEEPPRSPSRHALSEPGLSDVDSPDTADDEELLNGWVSGAPEQNATRYLARGFAHDFSLGNNGRVITSSSRLGLHLSQDASWFERNREVIYADSLGLHEFLDLVRCLQESRRALLGGEGLVAPDEEIAMVFLPLASEMPDGSHRMMLKDFKQAVRKSPRFLCVLGVASTHVSSPSLHSGNRLGTDQKAGPQGVTWVFCLHGGFLCPGGDFIQRCGRASLDASAAAEADPAGRGESRDATAEAATAAQAAARTARCWSSGGGKGRGGCQERSYCGHLWNVFRTTSRRTREMPGDTRPKGSVPTNAHSQCLARCALSAEAAPASAAAAAATVAAAAAVTALKQAEQQLNRILEESTLAAYQPLHIVDQLLMGMAGTCCVEGSQQEHLREGSQLQEQPHRVRKSIVRSRPVARHEKNAEAEGDCAIETSFAVASESLCRDLENLRRQPLRSVNSALFALKETIADDVEEDVSATSPLKTSMSTDAMVSDIYGGLGKDAKGLVVHFGHESWNMVINIMVGIRLAGGRAMSEPHRNVEPYDFVMKEKFSVLPKTGMVDKKQTSLCAVRFIDYAPMVFRRIRAIFGIDSLLYIRSVGPEQLLGNLILGNLSSLSELVSEGKSGSLFYYTTDGRFMIKTIEIGQERKKLFIDQLALDATFLRDHGIMDYSLLLGISYANRSQDSNVYQNGVFQINEDIPGSHSLTGNSSGASCVNPSVYSQRFVDFIACHTV